METNTILQGDCMEKLKELPEKSINMCMTSPPYWALRDYGTANWEGGDKNCEHKTQNNIKEVEGDWDRPSRKEFNKIGTLLKCYVCKKEFNGKLGNKFCSTACLNTLSNEERTKATSEMINTCADCGAKRIDKQLGLEPTFDEYINKLCNIFDEVKRVLRDDGTCWVNLGDTYGNSNQAGTKKFGNPEFNKNRPSREATKTPVKKIMGFDKCLLQIPQRFAIEMVNRGWILRNVIIWQKPNCMPSSVKDRFTVDFEYLFFFSKSKKYWFETQYEPIKEESKERYKYDFKTEGRAWDKDKNSLYGKMGSMKVDAKGRNKRTVWKICPRPFKEAHFAVYPEELCETPIKAGCPEFVCVKCGKAREKIVETENSKRTRKVGEGQDSEVGTKGRAGEVEVINEYLSNCGCNEGFTNGIVLDPFFGSGTTGLVALKQNKQFIGIELNPDYIEIANKRLAPHLEQEKL